MRILIMLNGTACLFLKEESGYEQHISSTLPAVNIEESQWFPGSFVGDNWN